jgi:predicted transcriptional regulator
MCSNIARKPLLDVLEQRIHALEAVRESGKDKRELVESLDCSRSTVDRSIRELESRGLVAYSAGEYHPTTFGRLALGEYRRFEERVETMKRLKPALEWLPVEEFDLDFGCLTDAEVIVSTPSDPYAPANRHANVASQAEAFRALLPAVGLNQLEAGRASAVEDDQRQRIVVEPGVAEQLRKKPHYAEKIEEMLDTGLVEISVSEGAIPYFLGLYDEIIHVGVEDEDGIPRALIETDAEAVREWADSTFAEYERRARGFDC